MKQVFTLLIAGLAAFNTQAQTLKEFFTNESTPLTYLGVDFSATKIQGETATATEIKGKFEAINEVVINEAKKYDVQGAFKRSSITNSVDVVKAVNDKVDADKIKTDNTADVSGTLKPEDIAKHVKDYNLSGKKGIGLVLIMDGMSKSEKEANMYVTLVDMAAKKVLFTQRMTGKAMGFGFRNYWAYTVYKVLNDIDKHEYKDWKNNAANAPEVKEEPVATEKDAPKPKKGKKA